MNHGNVPAEFTLSSTESGITVVYFKPCLHYFDVSVLRQSRIVGRNRDERSFHIFYQIHSASAQNLRGMYISIRF